MGRTELLASLELASANQPFKRWKRGQIIDWVTDVVANMIGDIDIPEDEVVATVKKFYDKVIRPIDIPGVPNLLIEPAVDEAVWKIIEFTIRRMIKDNDSAT